MLKIMKKFSITVILLFSELARALCLNPFGCEPTNLEECRTEAKKLPTDRGVSAGLTDCYQKFVVKPAEHLRLAKENKLFNSWKYIISEPSSITFDKVTNLLGKPLAEGANHNCEIDKIDSDNNLCKWYEWDSTKKGKDNCKNGTLFSHLNMSFNEEKFVYRAEFNAKTGLLISWYPDAISVCDEFDNYKIE